MPYISAAADREGKRLAREFCTSRRAWLATAVGSAEAQTAKACYDKATTALAGWAALQLLCVKEALSV
jgi:hypothetical protein